MKSVIFDVDGCLLDYEGAFGRFHGVDPVTYWQGGTRPLFETLESIIEFSDSEAFGNLLPNKGAVFVVEQLKEWGIPITVLSACGDDDETLRKRVANLDEVFGSDAFHDIILRPVGSSKKADLTALQTPKSFFVDDSRRHHEAALQLGYRSILFDTLYNGDLRGHCNTEQSWSGVFKRLGEFFA